jgi:hypothetical protein
MISFTENRYQTTLMRWLIIPSLLLNLLGGVAIQLVQLEFSVTECSSSTDARPHGVKFIYDADLSSPYNILGNLEVEEGDDDEDGRAPYLLQSVSVPSLFVARGQTGTSLFPPRKLVKLFILFHSWKSFLES